ncbi:MAG: hypothetical protein P8103_07930 [Candidatus Thiodiazotropha sp.]
MSDKPGTIITFYSYKGGTGRSMALANVAWILAANGYRVLAIDWDLEAPGLHRYFRPFLIDPELTDTPGLIDFLWSYASEVMTPAEQGLEERTWWDEVTDLGEYTVQMDWKFPDTGCLDLIPAGRQDSEYAERVNGFDWNNLYQRLDGALLIEHIKGRLKNDYDFVLIDSRTGVSDTSGICTVAMPDRLVAMFTLNRQSILGVDAVLESVVAQRDLSSLAILPIVTRVELAEKDRLEAARRRARKVIEKYIRSESDPQFMRTYWDSAEILYQPYYAYEEVLAPFGDATGSDYSSKSLLAAMENLAGQVTGAPGITMPEVPEIKRREVLSHFTEAKQAHPRGDDTQTSLDALAEERRERSDRYLGKELNNPIERLSQMAKRARQHFMIAEAVAAAAGILIAVSWLISGDVALAFIFGLLIAIASAIEIFLTSSRHKRQNDFANTALSTITIGAAFGVFLAGWYTFSLGDIGAIWKPLLLAAIAMGAELYALLGGFSKRTRQLDDTIQEIQQQQRFYVNSLEPYTDLNDEVSTWKSFQYRLEKILSEI